MALESLLAGIAGGGGLATTGAVGAGLGSTAGLVGAGTVGAGAIGAGAGTGAALGAGLGAGAAGATTAAGGTLLGLATVGSVVGSQVASTLAQANVLEAQEEQARINAAQVAAQTRFERGVEALEARRRVGRIRARIGASGVQQTGTAVSLISDDLIESQIRDAILLSQGGQALTRQQNIGQGISARRRGAVLGGSLSTLATGLVIGNQFRRARSGILG